MEKQYLIKHKDVLTILKGLDEIPYKYVKNMVPYFESALEEVKNESKTDMEETKKTGSQENS